MSLAGLLRDLDALKYPGHRDDEAHHLPYPPLPAGVRDAVRAALDAHCAGWVDDLPRGRPISGAERTRRWRERRKVREAA